MAASDPIVTQAGDLPAELRTGQQWALHGPLGEPDFANLDALKEWIAHVRSAAFLGGARHGRIDEIEATLIVQALARHRLASLPAQPEPAKPADLCAESAQNSDGEVGKLIERLRSALEDEWDISYFCRGSRGDYVDPTDKEGYLEVTEADARLLLDTLARLAARLELTGEFADGPDGIECRDDTIKLLDERIARLEAERRELVEMVRSMIPTNLSLDNHRWPDDTNVPIDVTLGELRAARDLVAKHTGGEG